MQNRPAAARPAPGGSQTQTGSGFRTEQPGASDRGASDGGEHPMTEAKKVGSELVGAARDSAVSLLDGQRARAADQIAAVGEALRRSAESLDGTGGQALVRYADEAATQISDFADVVRDRSWGELGSDVENFARRWPSLFMASAFGIGFLAGRFMLSSASHPPTGQRPADAGRSGAATTSGRIGAGAGTMPSGAGTGYASPTARE